MAQYQSNGAPTPYGAPSSSQVPYGAQQSDSLGQGTAQPRPFYGEQHNNTVPEPQFMAMQPMGQMGQQPQHAQPCMCFLAL
jgi:hypothetical protein